MRVLPDGEVDALMSADDRLRAELSERRSRMGLLSTPGLILRNFTLVIFDGFRALVSALLAQRIFLICVLLPLVGSWVYTRAYHPSYFTPPVCGVSSGGIGWQLELAVREAAWWITLGILSSVGFGTGLHSGLMFLFPHVMNVVLTVRACDPRMNRLRGARRVCACVHPARPNQLG